MAAPRGSKSEGQRSRRPPARTPEDRENQMIAKAVDLAEKQIENGTASAQVISHFLKLGSTREKLEQARLQRENELADAKIKAIENAGDIKEMYAEALASMRQYSGQEPIADDED